MRQSVGGIGQLRGEMYWSCRSSENALDTSGSSVSCNSNKMIHSARAVQLCSHRLRRRGAMRGPAGPCGSRHAQSVGKNKPAVICLVSVRFRAVWKARINVALYENMHAHPEHLLSGPAGCTRQWQSTRICQKPGWVVRLSCLTYVGSNVRLRTAPDQLVSRPLASRCAHGQH